MLPTIKSHFNGLRLLQNSLVKCWSTFNGRNLHIGPGRDSLLMRSCLPGYSNAAAKRSLAIPSANNLSMANQSIFTPNWFSSIRNQSSYLSSFSPEQVKMTHLIGGLRDCWVGSPCKGSSYSKTSCETLSTEAVSKMMKETASKISEAEPKICIRAGQFPKGLEPSHNSGLCTISLQYGSQTYPLVSFHIEPNVIQAMETSYSKPDSKVRSTSEEESTEHSRPRKKKPSRIPVRTPEDSRSDEMLEQCQSKQKPSRKGRKQSTKIPVRKPSFETEAETCTCTCTCRNVGTDSEPKMACSCTCVQCGTSLKSIEKKIKVGNKPGLDEQKRGSKKELQKAQLIISCSPKTEKDKSS